MKSITKKNGVTIERCTRESIGLLSPAAMCIKKESNKAKKNVYAYGMNKDEYENYLDNLYS